MPTRSWWDLAKKMPTRKGAEKRVPTLALRRSHVPRSLSLSRPGRQRRNRPQFVASRLFRGMMLCLRNFDRILRSATQDWTHGKGVIVWEIMRGRQGVRMRRSCHVWRFDPKRATHVLWWWRRRDRPPVRFRGGASAVLRTGRIVDTPPLLGSRLGSLETNGFLRKQRAYRGAGTY